MLRLMLSLAAAAVLPEFSQSPISFKDYPIESLRNNEESFQQIALIISPSGGVEDCVVLVPSNYPRLDAATCAVYKKAHAVPGHDAKDQPIYGIIQKWTSWSIGRSAKPPAMTKDVELLVSRLPAGAPKNPATKLALIVDEKGQVESCDIAASSGSDILDALACKSGVQAAKIDAIKNSSGVTVRSVQPLFVGFSITPP